MHPGVPARSAPGSVHTCLGGGAAADNGPRARRHHHGLPRRRQPHRPGGCPGVARPGARPRDRGRGRRLRRAGDGGQRGEPRRDRDRHPDAAELPAGGDRGRARGPQGSPRHREAVLGQHDTDRIGKHAVGHDSSRYPGSTSTSAFSRARWLGGSTGATHLSFGGGGPESEAGLGDTLAAGPPGAGVDPTGGRRWTALVPAPGSNRRFGLLRRSTRLGGEQAQLIAHVMSITGGWDSYSSE